MFIKNDCIHTPALFNMHISVDSVRLEDSMKLTAGCELCLPRACASICIFMHTYAANKAGTDS